MWPRQGQRFRAVLRTVLPRPLVQSAGDPRQVGANDVLGAIAGASVHNHPMVDQRQDTVQTATDHRRLVFDNHAKANAGLVSAHGGFWGAGWKIHGM